MENVVVITKDIKGEEWEKILDETFKKKRKDVKIDGFRKGCVPKDVFMKKVGVESLYMDAVDEALRVYYKEMLDEKNVVPVIEPKVDIKEINEKKLVIEITVITAPKVELGEYKNLGIKKDKVKVTKEEIDEEIKNLTHKYADIVVKENGEVAVGNTAVIDFEGFVDGEKLEGGSGENYPLEIGSHTFIPGFEEGLVGMKAGESKELNLKFPENYTEELKGKDVLFKVTVNEIKERVLPELTKEFYEDLGFENVNTEDEFRKAIEDSIKKRKEIDVENKFIEECLDKASENIKVEINPEIIDDEVHRMMHQFEQQIQMQGINLEQYMQFTGQTHDDFHKQLEPEAIKRLKSRYLLEEIAKVEDITISDEEAEAEAAHMAEHYGITKDELLMEFGGLEIVKYDMKMRKAMEILKNNN